MLKLGQPDDVWPLLKHSPYPEARSRLVMLMGQGGVPAKAVVDRLEVEKDVSARRALIVALGEYAEVPGREALTRKLLAWYRDDPDAGIHGAIDWLLRHGDEGPVKRPLDWGQRGELARIDGELAAKHRAEMVSHAFRNAGLAFAGGPLVAAALSWRAPPDAIAKEGWYVNGQGQTFAVIDAREPFLMGSPEDEAGRRDDEKPHWRRVGRRVAVQTKPVTVAEWARFKKAHPEVFHGYTKQYSPVDDGPIITVTWYDAAMYFRWLSEREGMLEHEMVYPPIKTILQASKDETPLKLPKDHLTRRGYRLPSEAEWEYACRAGTATSRYYGSSLDILPRYGWYLHNSQDRTWPVGQKRPNDFGLFDMHGNVFNWCQESGWNYPEGSMQKPAPDNEDIRGVTNRLNRILRGGSFYFQPPRARSSFRNIIRPADRFSTIGLRLCRPLP